MIDPSQSAPLGCNGTQGAYSLVVQTQSATVERHPPLRPGCTSLTGCTPWVHRPLRPRPAAAARQGRTAGCQGRSAPAVHILCACDAVQAGVHSVHIYRRGTIMMCAQQSPRNAHAVCPCGVRAVLMPARVPMLAPAPAGSGPPVPAGGPAPAPGRTMLAR